MDKNLFSRTLIKFDERLAKIEAAVLIMLVVAMTVVVFLQVFYRYVLTQPLYWSEELARYLFVWLSILGATLGLQRGGHFGLDILCRRLPEKGRRYTQWLIHLLMGVVIFVILFLPNGVVGDWLKIKRNVFRVKASSERY